MKSNWFLLVIFILTISSCEQNDSVRQYSEDVSSPAPRATSMDMSKTESAEDPHAFMKNKSVGGDPHAGYSKEELQAMLQDAMHGQGQSMPASSENRPIQWTVPETWQEKPATGMRIASFVNKNQPEAIDCSLVTLGPAAGGIEPNVIRWIQQLKMDVPQESQLKAFINQQEKVKLNGDLTAEIFDFTQLQKKSNPTDDSMLAAIIDTPQQRVFLKMTGKKSKVLENQKSFMLLLKSLHFNF